MLLDARLWLGSVVMAAPIDRATQATLYRGSAAQTKKAECCTMGPITVRPEGL